MSRTGPEKSGKGEYERSPVGAWYFIDESKTGWSAKFARPWLVVDTSSPGPFLEVIPRSTTTPRSQGSCRPHKRHSHAAEDEDAKTCRINRDGWIVPDERQIVPRKWIERPRSYSCREYDEVLLDDLGCVP